MNKIQESSLHFWPCYYVGSSHDDQVLYFSGNVLTNYLACGMLQINMIWQNVVLPRQYDNSCVTISLTQLWVSQVPIVHQFLYQGYIASQVILRQCCFHFCLQYHKSWCSVVWVLCLIVFCFSGGWSSVARTRIGARDLRHYCEYNWLSNT